jgi:hypothetical protein
MPAARVKGNGWFIARFAGLANIPFRAGLTQLAQLMFQARTVQPLNGLTTARITISTISTAGTSLMIR